MVYGLEKTQGGGSDGFFRKSRCEGTLPPTWKCTDALVKGPFGTNPMLGGRVCDLPCLGACGQMGGGFIMAMPGRVGESGSRADLRGSVAMGRGQWGFGGLCSLAVLFKTPTAAEAWVF